MPRYCPEPEEATEETVFKPSSPRAHAESCGCACGGLPRGRPGWMGGTTSTGATAPSVIHRKHHRITRQAGWEGGEREERKHMKGGLRVQQCWQPGSSIKLQEVCTTTSPQKFVTNQSKLGFRHKFVSLPLL